MLSSFQRVVLEIVVGMAPVGDLPRAGVVTARKDGEETPVTWLWRPRVQTAKTMTM
ncbi:hypothetical protein ElyMa_006019700, partial [Elysia marginata]